MPAFIIAIDGYSACGKSALSKALAKELGYVHIDTGAMYRAMTLYLLRHHIPADDVQSIEKELERIRIQFKREGDAMRILLNGEDVSETIRTQEISDAVSLYAKNKTIRDFATQLQRDYQHTEVGIVMDGRDIGTAVFPNANVKFFVISDIALRVSRRYADLKKSNPDDPTTMDEVKTNLLQRDHIDMTREYHPLTQAKDAIVLENNEASLQDLVKKALVYCR